MEMVLEKVKVIATRSQGCMDIPWTDWVLSQVSERLCKDSNEVISTHKERGWFWMGWRMWGSI